MANQHRIGIETLKLLVEVAWADREIAAVEHLYIMALADQLGASEAERADLRRSLEDDRCLPGADLSLLRGNREQVLRAVDHLIAADGRIAPDEVAARKGIERLLEADPPGVPEPVSRLFGELDIERIGGRVAALAGISHTDELERAIRATLEVAARYVGQGEFDFDTFVREVSAAEQVAPGFAREHAQVVLGTVGETLDREARSRIRSCLPPEMAPLFEPPVREPGAPRDSRARRDEPLDHLP